VGLELRDDMGGVPAATPRAIAEISATGIPRTAEVDSGIYIKATFSTPVPLKMGTVYWLLLEETEPGEKFDGKLDWYFDRGVAGAAGIRTLKSPMDPKVAFEFGVNCP
jgi:hypothetical protein